MKRVLFAAELNPSEKFGSFEQQVFALALAFRERSSLFLPLFSTELGPVAGERYQQAGLEAESLDLTRFRFAKLLRLRDLIRLHRIDVVHWNFHEPIKNGYLWALGFLLPGVEHYYTDHISRPSRPLTSVSRLKGQIKRGLFKRYAKVFCVSEFVAASLQAGDRWSQVRQWTLLIDTTRFAPDPLVKARVRQEQGAAGRFIALVAAHLVPAKGVDVAIRALPVLPETIVLWIIGGGPESDGLQRLARDLRVESRTRFLGLQRDVSPFMQAADCLVCPSLWAEAVGLVNLEGLACGLPVVASRIGGIPEFVEDGISGILFSPGDSDQLAAALRCLHEDRSTLEIMSEAARGQAVSNYSLDRRIGDYLDLYRFAPLPSI